MVLGDPAQAHQNVVEVASEDPLVDVQLIQDDDPQA
jgi:hypothetical protein